MESPTLGGAKTMPKRQKNAQLDDGLYDLIDHLQGVRGATYSRILTAALLKYVFGAWEIPIDVSGYHDDQVWMKIAVDLERGDITINEVPRRLIERALDCSSIAIAEIKRIEKPTDDDVQRKLRWIAMRGSAYALIRRWDDAVADLNDESAALRRFTEVQGFPPLLATGIIGT